MRGPSTPLITSATKRRSLSDCGVSSPCTFNVVWDGSTENTVSTTLDDSHCLDAVPSYDFCCLNNNNNNNPYLYR